MRLTRWILIAGVIVLSSISQTSLAGAGLATRDLNPVLQPNYLPTQAPVSADNGWRIDHSFFVTNTLQSENRGNESLIIDVENYRYELGLSYRKDRWLALVNVPLTANNGGELDGLIDSWHDFFGQPEVDRDEFQKDELYI